MPGVNISGTFKKDSRPDNGLEAIAEDLINNELQRHVVVGVVELHMVKKAPGEEPIPTVRFVAIEPLEGDASDQGRQMLNQARNARGRAVVPDGLFDMPTDDDTPPAAAAADQPQLPLDSDDQADDDNGPSSERVRDEWLDKDA
jgi:hypothetical protein